MKTIIIKVSGELFDYQREGDSKAPSLPLETHLKAITPQIKELTKKAHIGIVVGGGNFFRGAQQNGYFNLTNASAHQVGMLSTIVNGIILRDMFIKSDIPCELLSALVCHDIAAPATLPNIEAAFNQQKCVIFAGGTGNPFFTTDSNVVLRGLQTGADEVWKATKVDGVYSADPKKEKNCTLLKTISHQEVLTKDLKILDKAAVALAQEHKLSIRVFNMFAARAFLSALENPDFGSTIRSPLK